MSGANLSADEQRELAEQYQRLREEIDGLYGRLGQVDGDRSEHDLVLRQMKLLDGERRCWHQVGATLVEKQVKDVVPALQINRDAMQATVENLTKAVAAREDQLAALTKKYGIREVGASAAAAAASGNIE